MDQDFNKIKMLTDKLDDILNGCDIDEARSALLTLLTWHIASMDLEKPNDFIDYMCDQLKESVRIQIEHDIKNQSVN
jgi:hypothetical protein